MPIYSVTGPVFAIKNKKIEVVGFGVSVNIYIEAVGNGDGEVGEFAEESV